jgi:hypothetical protein
MFLLTVHLGVVVFLAKRTLGISRRYVKCRLSRESLESYRTGDLLVHVGLDPTSEVVEWYLNCNITHCGIVVRHPVTDRLYVFHSTPFGPDRDVLTDRIREGPILVDLRQHVAQYSGTVYRRPWMGEPWDDDRLWRLMRELNQYAYGYGTLFSLRDASEESTREVFRRYGTSCGVTCAYIWRRMGLLPESVAVHRITPDEFDDRTRSSVVPKGYGTIQCLSLT